VLYILPDALTLVAQPHSTATKSLHSATRSIPLFCV